MDREGARGHRLDDDDGPKDEREDDSGTGWCPDIHR